MDEAKGGDKLSGTITLRGIVFSRFKTVGDFADYIGWSRNKASRILNGIQSPSQADMEEIVDKLEITSPDLFIEIFFSELSSKWTNDNPKAG